MRISYSKGWGLYNSSQWEQVRFVTVMSLLFADEPADKLFVDDSCSGTCFRESRHYTPEATAAMDIGWNCCGNRSVAQRWYRYQCQSGTVQWRGIAFSISPQLYQRPDDETARCFSKVLMGDSVFRKTQNPHIFPLFPFNNWRPQIVCTFDPA
jgi:hypothetical protein